MGCSGSLKKGGFAYQWQAALALVGPNYDTSVEYTIFAGNGNGRFFSFNFIQKTIELNFSCQLLHYIHSMMISEHKNLDSAL